MAQRAAAPHFTAQVAAAANNQNALFVGPNVQPAAGVYHVLQCSCAPQHAHCYKVLLGCSIVRAVRRASADPLACPAIDQACRTYSTSVEPFRISVLQLWANVRIVWDWCDIPGAPRFHFDATVFWPLNQHARKHFEVDAVSHFNPSKTRRKQRDIDKDDWVNAMGCAYVRLHMDDQAAWPAKVHAWVTQAHAVVKYTPAYQRCLPVQQHGDLL